MKQSIKKAGGRYTTTRVQYKAVKKYDHTQFDDFCTAIYTRGVEDGRASVPGVDLADVLEAVKTVKGIGEKRLAQIEATVAAVFEGKKGGA